MSKADYAAVSADMAQQLSKYGTPIEARQVQIAEVGSAAVNFPSYVLFLLLTSNRTGTHD